MASLESIISDREATNMDYINGTPIRCLEDLEAILFERSSKRKITFVPLAYDDEKYRFSPVAAKKPKMESALMKKAAKRCLFSDR